MRSIKMLGLLAVSAMALVAFVGASSAMAEKGTFTAGEAGKAISETRLANHVFGFTGLEFACEAINFVGETPVSGGYKEQTISLDFKTCSAFGAKFDPNENGCELTFKSTTDANGMAAVDIHGCGTGTAEDKTKGIQFPVFGCKIDVPEQTIPSAVSYTNGANNDLVIKFTMTGIMFDATPSSILCPVTTGTHSGANGGSYVGQSTFQASGTSLTWSNV